MLAAKKLKSNRRGINNIQTNNAVLEFKKDLFIIYSRLLACHIIVINT